MPALIALLPRLIVGLFALVFILHGPVPQFDNYHAFADARVWLGIPNAADVLSNFGFALVGGWGLWTLRTARSRDMLAAAHPAYLLFCTALLATAWGSSYYHLAPDNARLLWDRLPIALACAGLLAAVRADTFPHKNPRATLILLSLFAVASVAWWAFTEHLGEGDLRPYILLQALPLVLIPLWQRIARAPRADRLAFAGAIALYVLAKAAELADHALFDAGGLVSGHTLKHLLATAAAGVLVSRLAARTSMPLRVSSRSDKTKSENRGQSCEI